MEQNREGAIAPGEDEHQNLLYVHSPSDEDDVDSVTIYYRVPRYTKPKKNHHPSQSILL